MTFGARELFYSLNRDEQIDLFKNPAITQGDKQKYLPVIINGLYVTMANVEGQQDSSDLLNIMKDSLKDVKTLESMNLQNEIGLWLAARSASTDQNALNNYNQAIQSNSSNPAMYYERALVELRRGSYIQALLDLDVTMALAQNLSSEASEKEIITPTPRSTNTEISQNTLSPTTITTPHVSTQTAESIITLISPTSLIEVTGIPLGATQTEVIEPPTVQPNYGVREGYKSSFYSIAYIRSAIDLILQGRFQNRDFQYATGKNSSALPNLSNAGLINPLDEIFYLAMNTSIAQTAISNELSAQTEVFAETPGITQTPLIEPSAVTSTPQIQQYFIEEFDQGYENWSYFLNGGDEDKFSLSVKDGELLFDLTGRRIYAYLKYDPVEYQDVRIDVSTQNIGVNENNMTLFCRYSQELGWYEFNIFNNGIYDIGFTKPNGNGGFNYSLITNGGSNKINQGHAVNEYSAICKGNTLTLYINGELTKTVDAAKYELSDGKVGLSVSSFELVPVQVSFDWIRISKP